MPHEIISVVVVRMVGTRDGMGGHLTRPEPVPGSPFACRLYRRNPQFIQNESAGGISQIDRQRILSFRDPAAAAALLPGDIALIPACTATAHKAERVTLQNPRPYGRSVQYDIESGATPKAPTGS